MYASLTTGIGALVCASLLTCGAAAGQTTGGAAAQSPWGPTDEIGRLNMMTEASQLAVLQRIASGKVYAFVFIGAPLKLRGATGAPMRPLAIPIR